MAYYVVVVANKLVAVAIVAVAHERPLTNPTATIVNHSYDKITPS